MQCYSVVSPAVMMVKGLSISLISGTLYHRQQCLWCELCLLLTERRGTTVWMEMEPSEDTERKISKMTGWRHGQKCFFTVDFLPCFLKSKYLAQREFLIHKFPLIRGIARSCSHYSVEVLFICFARSPMWPLHFDVWALMRWLALSFVLLASIWRCTLKLLNCSVGFGTYRYVYSSFLHHLCKI